jgi:hypothetical protein
VWGTGVDEHVGRQDTLLHLVENCKMSCRALYVSTALLGLVLLHLYALSWTSSSW